MLDSPVNLLLDVLNVHYFFNLRILRAGEVLLEHLDLVMVLSEACKQSNLLVFE